MRPYFAIGDKKRQMYMEKHFQKGTTKVVPFFVHFFTENGRKNAPSVSAVRQSKRMGCELWDIWDFENADTLYIYYIYITVGQQFMR